MCKVIEGGSIGRRSVLKFGAVGLATTGLAAFGLGLGPRVAHAAAGPEKTPDEALAKLRAGNVRYVRDPKHCAIELDAQRGAVAASQAPWATIIGCADSRVPPELIFGALGVGELFIARNAGNLADTATIGTVEYGSAVLGAPLIVVLAHTRCGAVSAACDVVTKNATYPGAIGPMIEPIVPAAVATRSEPGDFVTNAAKESARRTAGRLAASSSLLADRVGAGKLKIVAAIYDLDTGVVHFLD